MNEELERMLKARDKGVGETKGVLAKLWRQILMDRGITHMQWANLMTRYLNDPRNGIARDVKDKSSARGNLNKELKRPNMTWKVFRKGLRFLGPDFASFAVRLHFPDGSESDHQVVLEEGPSPLDQDMAVLPAGLHARGTRVLVCGGEGLPNAEVFVLDELGRLLDKIPAADLALLYAPEATSLEEQLKEYHRRREVPLDQVTLEEGLNQATHMLLFWDGLAPNGFALIEQARHRGLKRWQVFYNKES